ncbi:MAG: OmpA family protein [Gammaproteobacteria bacterium]|nr:MAG: OmpA family protein [Gammaproteobacteria bacterium]
MNHLKKMSLVVSMMAFAFSGSVLAGDDMVKGYVDTSRDNAVTTTRGNCVRTTIKDTDDKREACGYEKPAPVITKSIEVVKAKTAASVTARVENKVVLVAGILFDFDSAELSNDGKAIILERIQSLGHKENQAEITVVGHTCNMGPEDYNKKLSIRRAASVASFIEQMKKSPDAHVEFSGMGESEPAVSNDTKEGRMKNRRVVITAVGKTAK